MMINKRVPEIDGMRVDEAHKGGAKILKAAISPATVISESIFKKAMKKLTPQMPGQTQAELDAMGLQKKELYDLKRKEDARIAAMGRARMGRASLISGAETGLKSKLGQ